MAADNLSVVAINQDLSDLIVATGNVPATDDLQSDTAYGVLLNQLLGILVAAAFPPVP